jgi:ketosteroid isomerase-like protein
MKNTMTRLLVVFVVLLGFQTGLSQTPGPREWLAEIERDIWLPFMEGVRTYNDPKYLEVHSKDYVRIDPTNRFLLDRKDYDDDTVKMMARYKADGRVISITVRFEERIVDGKSAFERGINEFVITAKDGSSRKSYGRFQVVSRKENGKWRMLTEYFPPGQATSEQYLAAKAIGEYSAFLCYLPYPAKAPPCARQ